MMDESNKNKLVLQLAGDLLDDIEMSRMQADSLLLKASRLARLTGNDEIQHWLQYELGGYNSTDPVSLKYVGKTGRWIDREKLSAYWGPLGRQEASLAVLNIRLQGLRIPDINTSASSSNPNEMVSMASRHAKNALDTVINESRAVAKAITAIAAIRSRVVGLLHTFVVTTYYEALFSDISESIFGQFQEKVDSLLAQRCGKVLEKLPSIYKRLSEGDTESVSQALVSCRRIIDSFADEIYPAPDIPEDLEIDGKKLRIGAQENLNRIEAYVRTHLSSKSRRNKLRQSLSNLYDRVCTGVHNDVSTDEAATLFLETYLILGEILTIPSGKAVPDKTE